MASQPQKPHVSAALAQLRHGVSLAGFLVCVCALAQTLVFGFVHFTQVRFDKNDRPAAVQPLSVVAAPPAQRPPLPVGSLGPAQPAPVNEPIPTPQVLSGWDPTLHVMSDMAVSVGVIATGMLAALALLGVAIAGGGAVPGVDRAVSAASWALALALTCVPWRDVFVSLPFPGVFSG